MAADRAVLEGAHAGTCTAICSPWKYEDLYGGVCGYRMPANVHVSLVD